jgi:hypothetical protein
MTRGDKIVASVVVTAGVAAMALATVLPGWAMYPPRLGVQTALLVPFGHLGMRSACPGWLVLLLTCVPFIIFGIYLARGWVRGDLRHAVIVAATVYAFAVVAALLAGIHAR